MYDGTYALGGSLTVITGARSGPGDGWSWDSQPPTLNKPTSMQEIQNVYVGPSLKSGCTEIAGENNFDKFVENNTKVANYKDYIESTVGIPNVIL